VGQGGETTDVIIKKATRKTRKGRIVEKIKVVDIPLTAAENNLRGRVHMVRYKTYIHNGARQLNDSGYNVFDRDGHLTGQHAYDKKGNRKLECVYRYTDGRLQDWILNIMNRRETDTTTFRYDRSGNRILAVTRTNDSSRSGRKEYSFDNNGNETEVITYTLKNKVSSITRSEYDNRGNQIVSSELFPEGTHYMASTAEYDAYGALTALAFYVGESMTGRTEMLNDDKGKHIEMTLYGTDKEYTAKSVYTYDSLGNMLSRVSYGPDKARQLVNKAYEYKYDIAGNIIAFTEYEVRNGKRTPKYSIANEYTYFK
jgi:hypothetical protein